MSNCAEPCRNLSPGIETRKAGQGCDSFRLLRWVASQGLHNPLSSRPEESGDRTPVSMAAIAISCTGHAPPRCCRDSIILACAGRVGSFLASFLVWVPFDLVFSFFKADFVAQGPVDSQ